MIFKKFLPLIIVFLTVSFLSISVAAETSDNVGSDSSIKYSVPFDDSETVTFPFTFLGHYYTFYLPFPNSFMSIARDIVFYFLLIKSIYSKWKALPAIIGQVPVIGPTDSQQVAMYNSIYNK